MANEKPVKKYRIGAVDAAIWKNTVQQSKNGGEAVAYSVSLERRYQDQDGNWQGTKSFRTNDIPKAVLALQKAFEYIVIEARGNGDKEEIEEAETVEAGAK